MNTQATDKQQANFESLCAYIDDSGILENPFSSYFDPTDIDEMTTANGLGDKLEDAGAFNVEIIYYSNAMDYLSRNDPSLRESLELASDMGYEAKDLSSETLASIHASEQARRNWWDSANDIDDFLDGLNWDEPDEDEDEDQPEA